MADEKQPSRGVENVDLTKIHGMGNDLTVSITADVDEAVKGLKALQRELRKTTQEAREMERVFSLTDWCGDKVCYCGNKCGNNAEDVLTIEIDGKKIGEAVMPDEIEVSTKAEDFSFYDLSEVPTKELHEELAKREGVVDYYVGPHGEHAIIKFYDEGGNVRNIDVDGARILVNKD